MILAFALALVPLSGTTQEDIGQPRVLHRVTASVDSGRGAPWFVEATFQGLAPWVEHGLTFELPDWGEWTEVDSYYLLSIQAEPALVQDPEDPAVFRLAEPPPEDWHGQLDVTYVLATSTVGSRAREAHGLLPWRSGSYSHGFTANTLLVPRAEEGPEMTPRRELSLRADRPGLVFCGWGGIGEGSRTYSVPAGASNTVIAFGEPIGRIETERGGTRFEVLQFGGDADWTAPLLEVLQTIAGDAADTLATRMEDVRVLVTEPGFGGTRVEGALTVGASPSFASGEADPYTLHFLAHELFHHWLPGDREPGNGAMQWFFEGFTEYRSLWHLTRAGLVPPLFFATRLLDFESELEELEAWEDARFGDADMRWRHWRTEPVAYKGGALLALLLDVELREAGAGGLDVLLREFLAGAGMADGRFDHDWLRARLRHHGLADVVERFVDGTERPDVADLLERAGFERAYVPAMVSYFGVRTTQPNGGEVLEIDPEGPTAARDLRVGDVIFGRFPTRRDAIEVDPARGTRFNFGLTGFSLEQDGWYVDVLRDGEEVQVQLEPWASEGGRKPGWSGDAARLASFLSRDPQGESR